MWVLVYLRKWNIAQMKCNSSHVRWPKKSTNYFETQHCGVSWNFSICLIRSTSPPLFCPLTLMPTTCIYVGETMKNGLGSWLPWVACQPDCEGHRLVGWFSPQRIPCWVPAMAFWTCSFKWMAGRGSQCCLVRNNILCSIDCAPWILFLSLSTVLLLSTQQISHGTVHQDLNDSQKGKSHQRRRCCGMASRAAECKLSWRWKASRRWLRSGCKGHECRISVSRLISRCVQWKTWTVSEWGSRISTELSFLEKWLFHNNIQSILGWIGWWRN